MTALRGKQASTASPSSGRWQRRSEQTGRQPRRCEESGRRRQRGETPSPQSGRICRRGGRSHRIRWSRPPRWRMRRRVREDGDRRTTMRRRQRPACRAAAGTTAESARGRPSPAGRRELGGGGGGGDHCLGRRESGARGGEQAEEWSRLGFGEGGDDVEAGVLAKSHRFPARADVSRRGSVHASAKCRGSSISGRV
ncbi:hypothetical protein DAI22_09g085801 [Oryza sativa Japonica Group]|nr:hypothetical protein DAI22_09g085801 [Oryza sativa Japonica Group]